MTGLQLGSGLFHWINDKIAIRILIQVTRMTVGKREDNNPYVALQLGNDCNESNDSAPWTSWLMPLSNLEWLFYFYQLTRMFIPICLFE